MRHSSGVELEPWRTVVFSRWSKGAFRLGSIYNLTFDLVRELLSIARDEVGGLSVPPPLGAGSETIYGPADRTPQDPDEPVPLTPLLRRRLHAPGVLADRAPRLIDSASGEGRLIRPNRVAVPVALCLGCGFARFDGHATRPSRVAPVDTAAQTKGCRSRSSPANANNLCAGESRSCSGRSGRISLPCLDAG